MRTRLLFQIALLLLSSTVFAQEELLINVYNRTTTSLNGEWNYIVDPYENGYYNYRLDAFDQQEKPSVNAFFTNAKPQKPSDLIEYDFDRMSTLHVPGDWNSQKPELFYYEGTIWYKKSFDYVPTESSARIFLYFEASNYKTEVYLNGQKLGTHIGGFTPFNFDITDVVNEKDNFLVVKVDNKRHKDAVPTVNTDWWNYGGITRDVKIIETPSTFISNYFIQLKKSDNQHIKGFIQLDGKDFAQKNVQLSIPELNIEKSFVADQAGRVEFEITAKKLKYWSVENPYLYEVIIKTEHDQLTDQIGFRTIETQGSKILLNGEEIFLRGISIHEESPFHEGRGHSKEDAEQLLDWAQELGCNYVRLAHYPHNEHMVRLADQKGILVWEENPVYWTISWDNASTYQNAENQLKELIERDKNRASVIIWSMANETPNVPARYKFLSSLAQYTRSKDNTRLISAALEQENYHGDPTIQTIADPFAEVVDILSFNEYIGWYVGLPERCDSITWKITQDKPVLISEFGAGAKQGFHGEKSTRWTEEFQEELYIKTLKMIDKVDKIQGFSPWILIDFRSPRRVLPKIQDNWNRKGLLSEDGKKKKAFYILQDYYNNKK